MALPVAAGTPSSGQAHCLEMSAPLRTCSLGPVGGIASPSNGRPCAAAAIIGVSCFIHITLISQRHCKKIAIKWCYSSFNRLVGPLEVVRLLSGEVIPKLCSNFRSRQVVEEGLTGPEAGVLLPALDGRIVFARWAMLPPYLKLVFFLGSLLLAFYLTWSRRKMGGHFLELPLPAVHSCVGHRVFR